MSLNTPFREGLGSLVPRLISSYQHVGKSLCTTLQSGSETSH